MPRTEVVRIPAHPDRARPRCSEVLEVAGESLASPDSWFPAAGRVRSRCAAPRRLRSSRGPGSGCAASWPRPRCARSRSGISRGSARASTANDAWRGAVLGGAVRGRRRRRRQRPRPRLRAVRAAGSRRATRIACAASASSWSARAAPSCGTSTMPAPTASSGRRSAHGVLELDLHAGVLRAGRSIPTARRRRRCRGRRPCH